MKATSVRLPEAEVLLTIEASPEEMAEARERAYRELAPRVAVPGFRPGKAPRPMIEKQIGPARLLNEALDVVLPDFYRRAVEQENIHPYAQGEIEIEERDPLVVKIRMPVMPTVSLGDYRSIRVPKEQVRVEEAEVDDVIERIRDENAEWVPPVEPRPVQLGDRVIIDLAGSAGEEGLLDRTGLDVLVSEERGLVVPGLATEVVGCMPEEQKRVTLPLPETFSIDHLRGKPADFAFTVHEIKEKRLPEVDDEFAKTVGAAEGVAGMRAGIESMILSRKEQEEQERYEEALVDAVAGLSQVDYPRAMVDAEVERLMARTGERLRSSGVDLETYLRMSHKSLDDYRAELAPTAGSNIRTGLIVAEVARVENIHVEPAEIEAEIDRLIGQAGDRAAEVSKQLRSARGTDSIAGMLADRKALSFLSEIASGTLSSVVEVPAVSAEATVAEAPVTSEES